jgi:hypothetical protein
VTDKSSSAPDERAGKAKKRTEIGTELVPSVGGSAASLGGVALLGPPGALLGAVTSVALKRLMARVDRLFQTAADEFAARQLGPREQRRVALAYNRAAERLVEHLQEGRGLRDDGFFEQVREDQGTAAEEVLEGVLTKARDAYEVRKAERLGELAAFIAVSPDISPPHANYLIELAGRLTYQQLVLLGFFALEDRSGMPDWASTGLFTRYEIGLVAAIEELAHLGLIVRDDNQPVASFTEVNPRRMQTVLNGRLLHEAMSLHKAEQEAVDEMIEALSRLGTVDASEQTMLEGVVPRGEPPDRKLVPIDHRVVERPAKTLGLADEDRDSAVQDEP